MEPKGGFSAYTATLACRILAKMHGASRGTRTRSGNHAHISISIAILLH